MATNEEIGINVVSEGGEQEINIQTEPSEQLLGVGTEGIVVRSISSYEQLDDKPQINSVELIGDKSASDLGFADVAMSGSYNDLEDRPTIPAAQVNADWDANSGVAEILHKPTIPTKTSQLQNDSGFLTTESDPVFSASAAAGITSQDIADWNNKSDFSGNYNDLTNKPTIPTKTSQLTNNGSDNTSTYVEADELATVATSGDYNDLINKPTIPAAQVNSDWDAASGVAQILNKPSLATVATSGDYDDLINKPAPITVDSALSWTSQNPVENQAIRKAIYVKNGSDDREAGINIAFSDPNLNPYVHIGSKTSSTKGNKSVGIGYNAESSAVRSVAIGDSATASKREGVALGPDANAGQYSLSIGYHTETVPNYSTAVGPYAKVLTGATNATAIGYKSEASEAETVSVGKSTNRRRIVNVADGTTATDAATVGQIPSYSDFTGATSSVAGAAGLVPAPAAGDEGKFLSGAGTWETVQAGSTVTTFHWGGSPTYSMYKDSGYTTAATYSDIATAYADGLVYIADGEDEVTYVMVSDIPDAYTITVTGIALPGYEGGSTSYAYASSTWTKTATEFQKKLTAGSNITITGTTISATDTTYSDFVGATSLVAGSAGLVPAPTTSDTGKVLKGDGTWAEKSEKFVIMKYGEANAWAKFIAAYNENAIVYCRASSNANPGTGSQTRLAFMAYVSNETTPTSVEFQYVRSVGTKTSSQPVDQVFVYKLESTNGGTWTVQTRDMAPKLAAGTNTTVSYSNGTYTVSATQPTVPTKTSDLTNDGSDGTSTYVEADELATVATTGAYSDLSGTPSLAAVAMTGDYDDLTNKPTIPTVNNATLTIQKNGTSVGTFTANASANVTANITVPTQTSDLTNNSGFLTSSTAVTSFNGSTGAITYTAPVTSVNGSTGAITGLQTTSNLVTSVSGSSTDSQYPSAKLFYDTIGNVESILQTLNNGGGAQ